MGFLDSALGFAGGLVGNLVAPGIGGALLGTAGKGLGNLIEGSTEKQEKDKVNQLNSMSGRDSSGLKTNQPIQNTMQNNRFPQSQMMPYVNPYANMNNGVMPGTMMEEGGFTGEFSGMEKQMDKEKSITDGHSKEHDSKKILKKVEKKKDGTTVTHSYEESVKPTQFKEKREEISESGNYVNPLKKDKGGLNHQYYPFDSERLMDFNNQVENGEYEDMDEEDVMRKGGFTKKYFNIDQFKKGGMVSKNEYVNHKCKCGGKMEDGGNIKKKVVTEGSSPKEFIDNAYAGNIGAMGDGGITDGEDKDKKQSYKQVQKEIKGDPSKHIMYVGEDNIPNSYLKPQVIYSNPKKATGKPQDMDDATFKHLTDMAKEYNVPFADILDLHEKHGSPKIEVDSELGAKDILNPHWEDGKVRQNYMPLTNRMTIKRDKSGKADLKEYLQELSHAEQKKQGKLPISRAIVDFIHPTGGHHDIYKSKGSFEHEAHSEIEPVLKQEFNRIPRKSEYIGDVLYQNDYLNRIKKEEGGKSDGVMINIEKNELLTDNNGNIIKQFNAPPHPKKGIDPRGNRIVKEGTYVIPDKDTEKFKKKDFRSRIKYMSELPNADKDEELQGKKKMLEGGKISMSKEDFSKEHNRLLDILKHGTMKERKEEAERQEKERKEYKAKDGGMMKKEGDWIQKAVNPAHKGFCTPMTKKTCTPRRKAFAMTMKKHHGFHKKEDGGYINPKTFKFGGRIMADGGEVEKDKLAIQEMQNELNAKTENAINQDKQERQTRLDGISSFDWNKDLNQPTTKSHTKDVSSIADKRLALETAKNEGFHFAKWGNQIYNTGILSQEDYTKAFQTQVPEKEKQIQMGRDWMNENLRQLGTKSPYYFNPKVLNTNQPETQTFFDTKQSTKEQTDSYSKNKSTNMSDFRSIEKTLRKDVIPLDYKFKNSVGMSQVEMDALMEKERLRKLNRTDEEIKNESQQDKRKELFNKEMFVQKSKSLGEKTLPAGLSAIGTYFGGAYGGIAGGVGGKFLADWMTPDKEELIKSLKDKGFNEEETTKLVSARFPGWGVYDTVLAAVSTIYGLKGKRQWDTKSEKEAIDKAKDITLKLKEKRPASEFVNTAEEKKILMEAEKRKLAAEEAIRKNKEKISSENKAWKKEKIEPKDESKYETTTKKSKAEAKMDMKLQELKDRGMGGSQKKDGGYINPKTYKNGGRVKKYEIGGEIDGDPSLDPEKSLQTSYYGNENDTYEEPNTPYPMRVQKEEGWKGVPFVDNSNKDSSTSQPDYLTPDKEVSDVLYNQGKGKSYVNPYTFAPSKMNALQAGSAGLAGLGALTTFIGSFNPEKGRYQKQSTDPRFNTLTNEAMQNRNTGLTNAEKSQLQNQRTSQSNYGRQQLSDVSGGSAANVMAGIGNIQNLNNQSSTQEQIADNERQLQNRQNAQQMTQASDQMGRHNIESANEQYYKNEVLPKLMAAKQRKESFDALTHQGAEVGNSLMKEKQYNDYAQNMNTFMNQNAPYMYGNQDAFNTFSNMYGGMKNPKEAYFRMYKGGYGR